MVDIVHTREFLNPAHFSFLDVMTFQQYQKECYLSFEEDLNGARECRVKVVNTVAVVVVKPLKKSKIEKPHDVKIKVALMGVHKSGFLKPVHGTCGRL